jgi:hypothetical protein
LYLSYVLRTLIHYYLLYSLILSLTHYTALKDELYGQQRLIDQYNEARRNSNDLSAVVTFAKTPKAVGIIPEHGDVKGV